MNISAQHSSASRYSGRVLLAVLMLVFVFIVGAAFLSHGTVGKCDGIDARLAALNAPNAPKDKPKVGVVKGIVYSSSGSSALVDETIVHTKDTVHEITVAGIQSDTVEFAKDGVTWQQAVQESPHAA